MKSESNSYVFKKTCDQKIDTASCVNSKHDDQSMNHIPEVGEGAAMLSSYVCIDQSPWSLGTHPVSLHLYKSLTAGVGNLDDVSLAMLVKQDGRINAIGCQIQVRSNWNLELLDCLCQLTSDKEVALFMRFGWPTNRDNSPLTQTYFNHDSALQYPEQVQAHILKELKLGTLMGPFATTPFPIKFTRISPLSTRPKRNSLKRRLIMDLSWPIGGNSVNAGIPKDIYLGRPAKLHYPTVDDLCKRAHDLKKRSKEPLFGWKKDMERAFKQLPLDPSMWMELGLTWQGAVFFDKTAVMGC